MTGTIEFRIMGPLTVLRDGEAMRFDGARERAVLSMLVLEANRIVSVGRLIDAVWAGAPPKSARAQIATCVSRLRRALGGRAADGTTSRGDLITTRNPGYTLDVDPDTIDWSRFRALTAAARREAAAGSRAQAVATLREALALRRGVAFEGVHGMRCETAGVEEAHLDALESCVEMELELGAHQKVIAELTPVVAEHPLRERARMQLMLAQYRAGRRAEALRTYHDARRQLVEQIGLEPGPELRRLHERILRDAADLAPPPVGAAVGDRPLVVPSQLPPQALPFAGRTDAERELDAALTATGETTSPSPVILAGPSGVGKTALALRWAHRALDRFPDGQLFADLGDGTPTPGPGPGVVLDRFLRALGVPDRAIPADLAEKTALFRSMTAHRRLLVVLDGASGADQVLPLLPGGVHCRVIITSRDPLDELVARQGAHRGFVGPLRPEESRELLVMLVGRARVAAEPQAAGRLALGSRGFPMALRMAAARLSSNPPRSLEELAPSLPLHREELEDLQLDLGSRRPRPSFA
ncbi:DNA-binding SARP family transcriptional activator [Actinoalloteichus hoggarensis]|uniref:Regulatory protein AfsR n=1 Tax=Actinoalloteichus hoggarensis TaxID=1470176 RepID=A0A221VYV7_9PSEU|nr:BTAD domain-containing putative transcriptional regulator [Actinoalloteichus hoggarensis]ASO18743.1 Regulatory protein AfsR [Actinoalloteichus hoggarensis]MBB5919976.1 DNA-binding SARP family transcriptional activator [Actinoalloteichus hoggarensis]